MVMESMRERVFFGSLEMTMFYILLELTWVNESSGISTKQ